MAENYVLLQSIELNQTSSTVSFSNIPQAGYTDLKIVVSARSNRASDGDYIYLSLNGAQPNTVRYLKGYSTTANSGAETDNYLVIPSTNNTSNTYSNLEIYLPNYLSATSKAIISDDAYADAAGTPSTVSMGSASWTSGSASTSAVTSITLAGRFGSFIAGSTFSLYGIFSLNVTPTAPKANGGNQFYSDGTYGYHIFTTSGNFIANQSLTCDYLVVAGGGGGGGGPYDGSGGGGAGGLRSTVTATGRGGTLESPLSLTAGTYPVTIGAGGAGGVGQSSNKFVGIQGSSSVFSTVTSIGGGYGAANTVGGGTSIAGGAGGSGGGSHGTTSSSTGGAGTTNQGYNGGGTTTNGPWGAGGGGGGAGSAGGSGTAGGTSPNAIGGNGGAGVAVAITGSSVTYAGGGGGSTGYGSQGSAGSGGAGAGSNSSQYGNSGASNTGSGGGGNGYQGYPAIGGDGGSGIVVIRYAM